MSDFLSSHFSSVMANWAAGSSAGKSLSLKLDKRDFLENKLLTASSKKIYCLQETVSLQSNA